VEPVASAPHRGFHGIASEAVGDQTGRFELVGLPPARYLAIAIESVEPGAWTDTGYLGGLRPRATSLTLSEGETTNLNLRTITSE